MIQKLLAGLLVLLIAIQFVRPAKNESVGPSPDDITARLPVPASVTALLQRACYDCHSNRTNYPWYAAVQPVGWWLARHVNNGKRHLNFSEFAAYAPKRAANKLDELIDEVEQGHMPLKSYTWMHPEARLTPEEIRLLVNWAETARAGIPPR